MKYEKYTFERTEERITANEGLRNTQTSTNRLILLTGIRGEKKSQ